MDKTKSMDFGMDIGPVSKIPHVSVTDGEKSESRSRRQMSLEMDMHSPYLLPDAIDSVASLARTVSATEDHVFGRPMTAYSGSGSITRPGNASTRNNKPSHERDSSVYTAQFRDDESPRDARSSMKADLLGSAQIIAASSTSRTASRSMNETASPVPRISVPFPVARSLSPNGLPLSPHNALPDLQKINGMDLEKQPPPTVLHSLPPSLQVGTPSPSRQSFPDPFLDPIPSHTASASIFPRPLSNDESEYGDDIQVRFSNASEVEDRARTLNPRASEQGHPRQSLAPGTIDPRRLSMGFRPLPPEGNPDDTAEQRALRIRSFYKEYFSVEDDHSTNAPPLPTLRAANHGDNTGSMYDDTAAIFDPETGRFIMPGTGSKPFAELPIRRAMTPPPRMPPGFDGLRSRAGSLASGGFVPSGPRAFSSASGRIAGPIVGVERRQGPRRPIEPPKPLHLLPTPGKMGEDAFSSPNLFAPPIRINRDGIESPSLLGGLRPYSPTVQPHIPLASAFDELASLPSAHMLRNSSTFTALDFAPPKKFKNEGDMSDAGSIHSNQSGVSAMQIHNIRNGAYRVSRIPTDVVPLKEQMNTELKPSWDVRHK